MASDETVAAKLRHDTRNEALVYLAQAELLLQRGRDLRDRFAARSALFESLEQDAAPAAERDDGQQAGAPR